MLSPLEFFRRRKPALPAEPLRILHAPYSIAGNAYVVSELEREFGVESELVVFEDTSFGFKRHRSLNLKGVSGSAREKALRRFLMESLDRYHIYHFNFGMSLLHRSPDMVYEDFEILKSRGKKIFITYQGCDIRDKDFSLKSFTTNACENCEFVGCDIEFNRWKRRSSEKASLYADQIYVLNPDLLNACPSAKFIPYASVDASSIVPLYEVAPLAKRPVRILHAPTSRSVKGSVYILEALSRLQKERAIEIILVEGLSHSDALSKYRQADVVVDQLLFGWYGAFAVECMALGKPVLAYLRDDDLSKIPSEMRAEMGVYRTSRETIYQDLLNFVDSFELRTKWAHRGREFSVNFHNPRKIVSEIVSDYRRSIAKN